MKPNKLSDIIVRINRGILFLGLSSLFAGIIFAQESPLISEAIPAEAIQQGRNRGVETWEGTLFGQDSYKPGSYAQIEVVPNPGFEFEKWAGETVADLKAPKTFVTMNEHTKVKPFYKRIWNVIGAPDKKEAGEVKGSGNFPDGSEVKLSVTPNEGFKFLGWNGKGVDEEKKEELEITITVDGDHDIVATFEQDGDGDGGGGGGGGDSNENQDESEDQEQNEEPQDPQDQNQDESEQNEDEGEQPEQPEDQGGEEEQPQEPEPEEGENQGEQEEQGDQGEEEEEAPAGEGPKGGQPIPMQMTPEEAVRLLEAMEDGEKKLPLFIVQPPNKKDSKKDW
ncbi:MAG: hypothetical protein O3C43_16825 [Verrucomicrobia bacterium]|nr:hypothetical protein [Verrucomicrobiota bacterium]MDA1068153.1 hypothetical protein [Verrucomicrobiota bacterium]